MKKKLTFIMILVVLALTSCSDFLDKYPKYGVDPESEVTNEIAVALTTACYKTLQSSNMYNQRLWSLDILAGNSEAGEQVGHRRGKPLPVRRHRRPVAPVERGRGYVEIDPFDIGGGGQRLRSGRRGGTRGKQRRPRGRRQQNPRKNDFSAPHGNPSPSHHYMCGGGGGMRFARRL